MQKIKRSIFCTDLDNTLIYSYRHAIGSARRCAEIYQGREISYMTETTRGLLNNLQKQMLIIPVTTRTTEQYARVDLGIETPAYALTCNGGVLLANGREDASWYQASKELVSDCKAQLALGSRLLEHDKNRCLEVRNIRGLFLFTKSSSPAETKAFLQSALNPDLVNILTNGVKIYIVPRQLNKGTAVRRLRACLRPTHIIAAGDSEFDIPMLTEADTALAPQTLAPALPPSKTITLIPDSEIFSDRLLTYITQNPIPDH